MKSNPTATLSFTKLIVNDLEKLAAFYAEAYGFEQNDRIQANIAGEPIDEIILGKRDGTGAGLVLLKYLDRPAPTNGELILGFMTDDIDALFDRIRAAGGGVHDAPHQSEAAPFKVGFSTDPEGHLIENVEIPS